MERANRDNYKSHIGWEPLNRQILLFDHVLNHPPPSYKMDVRSLPKFCIVQEGCAIAQERIPVAPTRFFHTMMGFVEYVRPQGGFILTVPLYWQLPPPQWFNQVGSIFAAVGSSPFELNVWMTIKIFSIDTKAASSVGFLGKSCIFHAGQERVPEPIQLVPCTVDLES
jgi:hypothetical protein